MADAQIFQRKITSPKGSSRYGINQPQYNNLFSTTTKKPYSSSTTLPELIRRPIEPSEQIFSEDTVDNEIAARYERLGGTIPRAEPEQQITQQQRQEIPQESLFPSDEYEQYNGTIMHPETATAQDQPQIFQEEMQEQSRLPSSEWWTRLCSWENPALSSLFMFSVVILLQLLRWRKLVWRVLRFLSRVEMWMSYGYQVLVLMFAIPWIFVLFAAIFSRLKQGPPVYQVERQWILMLNRQVNALQELFVGVIQGIFGTIRNWMGWYMRIIFFRNLHQSLLVCKHTCVWIDVVWIRLFLPCAWVTYSENM